MSPGSGPPLHPVFLRLAGRRVLLVGGGAVAGSKLAGLLAAGAQVTVVAPEITADIQAAPVRVRHREFRPADLAGAWLAVAAASPRVNREVARVAEARRVFVNAVDDPVHASAYAGGVLRRGGIVVAVSTEGRAPALAGLVREALEAVIPEDVQDWVELAATLREEQRRTAVPMGQRRTLLLRALVGLLAERHEVTS